MRRLKRYRRVLTAGETGPASRYPDTLMCDLALTGMFNHAGRALRVYHAHNVEAQRWESTAPRVFARAAWGAKLAALERRAVQESDLCVACTDDDAELLRTLHGAREVEVVANGYDETALSAPTPAARASARRALGIPEQCIRRSVRGRRLAAQSRSAGMAGRAHHAAARARGLRAAGGRRGGDGVTPARARRGS